MSEPDWRIQSMLTVMKALAVLIFGITARAAVDDDPLDVLMRVRDRVVEQMRDTPNHTCVETIVRDHYHYLGVTRPKSCDDLLGQRKRVGLGKLIRIATTDRLRLDV